MTLTESINLLETEDDSITFKIKRSCQVEVPADNDLQETIIDSFKKESKGYSQKNEEVS